MSVRNQLKLLVGGLSARRTGGSSPPHSATLEFFDRSRLVSMGIFFATVAAIVLTRPAVEAGETLGFLPGDLREKILPYLRPLYDALHDMLDPEDVARLTEKGIIEIAPLAYMRGRTLSRAFVVLDEAQNTTPEQMMMFLTRLGEDSRMVVTGDITQIDLPRSKQSGLLEVRHILADIPGIDFHTFSAADVVRHPLVQKIIEAYERYRNPIGNENGAEEKR